MDVEAELTASVRLGRRAADLLADDTFDAVLNQLVEGAISEWRSAIGPALTPVRERCHAIVYGLDQVRAQLATLQIQGELAQQRLDEMEDQE